MAQTLPPLAGQLMYATQVVGTVTNLVSFDEMAPATLRSTAPITGIATGQIIVGMDVRPRTGQLYALAYNAALTAANARLYTINPTTAVATPVGAAAIDLELGAATARIGIDFNPLVDLLRVVSTNRANYRLNPTDGTVVDADPATAGIQRDGDLTITGSSGVVPTISAAAYSNNFFGTGNSSLAVYDEALNQFFYQSPANAGVLTPVGILSGITVNRNSGISLDINSVRSGEDLVLLAAATGTSTNTQLFEINLGSGVATLRGTLGNGLSISNVTFATFAVDPVSPPAALTGQLMFALTGSNLISFDSSNPRVIRTSTPVTNLAAGQTLVGLDFRPATGELFALGYNATAAAPTANAQLYTINPGTGALTAVGAAQRLELGDAAARVGFDFNPVADRIRVVSTNNKNYRLNPTNGAIAATDPDLNPAGGVISSAAYTNSGPGAAPATTALYNYNAANNQLVQQADANAGTFATVGASGITVNAAAGVDFDIYFDPAAPAATQNKAFLVASTGTGNFVNSDRLYTVNLTTGAATEVEIIGTGMPITGVSALISGTVLSSNKASAKVSAQVDVYPNPATGEVSINMPASLLKQSVQATLVNALGQSVLSRTLSARDGVTQRLSLTNVAKGIYMLQLSTPEGVVTKRLMVR
ncbi:hypothetical protein GCM10011375_34750 [Hymenobacter qilianensis]|uniref:Uncharacterized protein n=3 Tax=Hymenobacter qilianensis TaxID=1385715 RepID=A0ACB5PVW8_9BACT|nr:DUF4394 domain-containing protein [Hymenobacter qilianensis]QNP51282.1 DUF4394 domain-containing protein [Hymenobacter qilianensis]GGF76753.1 hypothetical protein GCM10011375_34750 [Hymenobacter qilianensis]